MQYRNGDETKAPAVHLHRLSRGKVTKNSTKIMKTSDIETKFWGAFLSGEHNPESATEFFGLQDTEKETPTTVQTKTVTRGIYNRVATGEFVGNVEQYRHDKVGEQTTVYTFEAVDDSTLSINGKCYRVEDCGEFAIKVMKTKIKASDGAKGIIKLFMHDALDTWELKIIENCKPINMN